MRAKLVTTTKEGDSRWVALWPMGPKSLPDASKLWLKTNGMRINGDVHMAKAGAFVWIGI